MQQEQIHLPTTFVDELSATVSLEEVLKTGARWVAQIIGCERAGIAFLEDGSLIAQAFRPDGNFEVVPPDENAMATRCRGQVLRTGQPLFLDRAGIRAAGGPVFEKLLKQGVASMVINPMFCGKQIVGTISASRISAAGFSVSESDKIITLGKWIAAQARLMQQARHTARLAETDMLTGLANRARLMRVLNGPGTLNRPDGDGNVIGVMQIDLDHFKAVNDTLGHSVGDAILKHAAQAMESNVGLKDLVARTGGDEFVIVTRTDPRGAHITQLAHRLARAISTPLRVGDIEAQVGTSIGIATAGAGDQTAEKLIGKADIALYQVKRTGRGGVCAFNSKMRAETNRRVRLLSDLRAAVDACCFEPYFQPQVTMDTGQFRGFEMLARWPHPTLGLIDPDDFIELSAMAGLTDRIDTIVRAKGLAALRRLRADGWNAPKMSFNASARTLSDRRLVHHLVQEVQTQGLAPEDLVLEVREVDLMAQDKDQSIANINALSEAGFEVELDDFGSGYFALSNLSKMSISAIKLDCALIASMSDPQVQPVVRAMIAMAKALGLNVVAEGVENNRQYSMLRSFGCDVAQGFGVSKPLPLEELVSFKKGYGRAPVALATAGAGMS